MKKSIEKRIEALEQAANNTPLSNPWEFVLTIRGAKGPSYHAVHRETGQTTTDPNIVQPLIDDLRTTDPHQPVEIRVNMVPTSTSVIGEPQHE